MRVLGVVVEYNPFHFGHLHHLREAIDLVKPDYVIAVMSGNFCQRGEPAIINKFARAEIALRMGIDVVFELPTVYAVQDAGGFALGSVGVLHKTNVVTDIVFGSESGDLCFLQKVARLLTYQTPEFQRSFKMHLKMGYSYPNARKYALMDVLSSEVEKLSKSNDILGIEYIKSLIHYGSKIEPHVIRRVGADDNDETLRGKFSSASAIRKAIREGKFEESMEAIPPVTFEILNREFNAGRGPVFWKDLSFVIPTFRKMSRSDFQKIYSFNEGLDLRFYEASRTTGDLQQFVEFVKAKRFTYSRIRRAILHAFFGFEKEMVEESNKNGPQYLRLLGFTNRGREILKEIKKKATIPIVSTPSLVENVIEDALKRTKEGKRNFQINPELFRWQLQKDLLASDIYTFMYPDKSQAVAGMDFREPVFIEH
uniref:tRNA(Met) cytidine acetate ligase n=1 Tax=Fervidobacterium thailandense TaxID=1008305 RepID=A0A7C4GJL0_9BACT